MKFKVGDLVRITKEKVKLDKGNQQTFSTYISGCQDFTARAPTGLPADRCARSS